MFSQEKARKIITPLTYLKCLACSTINSRPFRDGDYIFKEVEEKCPKCGSDKMKIVGIYVKEEAKKRSKSRL
ncbi:MAG: hypothetical protein DRN59_03045 [Thaumarchaeota archaeon]|nr:MAG: hypothetical protein DRN59_03045 [Nitrososphaerota archaeon]